MKNNGYKFLVFVFLVFVFSVVSAVITKHRATETKTSEKIIYKTVKEVKIVKVKEYPEGYISPEKVFEWYPFLEKQCKLRKVDTKLMMAVFKGESDFKPKLVNPESGCTGMGQISYDTYIWLKKDFFPEDRTKFSDMKDPYHNIRYCVLRMKLARIEAKNDKKKMLHIYGGCRSKDKKEIYVRYINKNHKDLYGKEMTL